MNIDIDKLERKAKAATPGPWRVEVRTLKGFGFCIVASGAPYHSGQIARCCLSSDAVFVASANPAAVLELVGEVRRLRAELAASQAREKVLREALMHCSTDEGPEQAWVNAAREALALPADDTALCQAIRAAKEEMRERAAIAGARIMEEMGIRAGGKIFADGQVIADAIRALEVE